MQAILFPNVEKRLAQGLQAWLAGRGITVPVGGRTPDPRPAEYIRLYVIGGTRRDLVTDQPTVVVETYARTDERASDLANLARAYINALEGTDLEPGAAVYRVGEFSRPANLPDPTTTQSRYTATYSLDIRGTAI